MKSALAVISIFLSIRLWAGDPITSPNENSYKALESTWRQRTWPHFMSLLQYRLQFKDITSFHLNLRRHKNIVGLWPVMQVDFSGGSCNSSNYPGVYYLPEGDSIPLLDSPALFNCEENMGKPNQRNWTIRLENTYKPHPKLSQMYKLNFWGESTLKPLLARWVDEEFKGEATNFTYSHVKKVFYNAITVYLSFEHGDYKCSNRGLTRIKMEEDSKKLFGPFYVLCYNKNKFSDQKTFEVKGEGIPTL